MKSLLIVRHCKSDWSFLDLSDHQRPLNNRGLSDCEKISARFKKLDPTLEKIYHSTAKRATDTAQAVFKFGKKQRNFEPSNDLYTFAYRDVLKFINNLPDKESDVAIVGHNPALTELICALTHINLDNLPTGGYCLMHFDVDNWAEIAENTGKVKYLEYPKMLKN